MLNIVFVLTISLRLIMLTLFFTVVLVHIIALMSLARTSSLFHKPPLAAPAKRR